ncbi:MAG: hypothetical protein II304_06420 [Bacteroidales bacterium]|nr:hypothetical protein [Bacteroidales bacterium]
MNEELTNILEGIETANNIQQYEEGAKDKLHIVGNTIKNLFGSKSGEAGRANADAQTALNTAKTNQQARKTNAQTNAIENALDDLTLAKNLNDVVTDALGIVEKGLASLPQQEPKPNNQKPQQQDKNAAEQRLADTVAAKNSKAGIEDNPENQYDSFMDSQIIDFTNALREAANTNTKAFYNKAAKSLKAIQAELRPFLTGQKDFTVADLDKISNLINDQSISTVLGKNDKKALQTIQNVNSMIKNKKISIGDDGSTAQNQQTQNPQPSKANSTGSASAAEQGNSGAGDANNIANNAKAKPTVDAINRGLSSGLSVDDLIAYLQTLKK